MGRLEFSTGGTPVPAGIKKNFTVPARPRAGPGLHATPSLSVGNRALARRFNGCGGKLRLTPNTADDQFAAVRNLGRAEGDFLFGPRNDGIDAPLLHVPDHQGCLFA